jgi:alanine racemase
VRPSRVEVDLDAIRHNVRSIAGLVGPAEVCAVVKADAYGHGDVPVAAAALESGAASLAVALPAEAIRLREAGIEAPILLLSEPPATDAPSLLEWDITPTVYTPEFVDALASCVPSARIGVHLKVDTGMHRVGAAPDSVPELARTIHRAGLRLDALWTHFAVADEDPAFTAVQVERFDAVAAGLAAAGIDVPRQHLANTAGALLHTATAGRQMVRVGLGIYGLYPCEAARSAVDLTPAMRVVSRVSHLLTLSAGERPSYGRRRPLGSAGRVASVPIGYADGVPRILSSRGGEVLIRDRRFPLAGTVTMDQIVVDIGDAEVEVGDEVVLIGRQGDQEIPADEWAARTETISYEIVCGMGPRLPRRHMDGEGGS